MVAGDPGALQGGGYRDAAQVGRCQGRQCAEHLADRRAGPGDKHGLWHRRAQTLRRYWPPTSKKASVICCRLHTRAASIKTANTLPPPRAVSLSAARAAWASSRCRSWKSRTRFSWDFFSSLGAAGQRDRRRLRLRVRVAEGVDADERQRAVVLALLVEHGLVLDLAALVAGLHRAEHPAAGADRLELRQHGLLDQVGELIDDEGALQRVLVHRQAPLAADDQLDRQRPAHRLLATAW